MQDLGDALSTSFDPFCSQRQTLLVLGDYFKAFQNHAEVPLTSEVKPRKFMAIKYSSKKMTITSFMLNNGTRGKKAFMTGD